MKHTYDSVRLAFKKEGYELISKEYIGYSLPLKFICPKGHQKTISLRAFLQGSRCITCGGRERHTLEFVRDFFQKQKCQLLEKEYINAHLPLKYICECGTEDKKNFCNFKSGQRCPKCKDKKMSGEGHWAWMPDREKRKSEIKLRKQYYFMLQKVLKSSKTEKIGKTELLLGYTCKELQNHIFNHPNWQLCKGIDWDVDHIFPIKAFLEAGITYPKVINSLDNLQPLPKEINASKSCKYNKEEFEIYLKIH